MKYFTIKELCRSATADRYGIINTPDNLAEENLRLLVHNVLDPLREAYGHPIHVNSGYRNHRLNRLVSGTHNSQHLFGQAADITAGSLTENRRLFQLAIALRLPFDQLIDERGYSWIHISHIPSPPNTHPNKNRKQILHL